MVSPHYKKNKGVKMTSQTNPTQTQISIQSQEYSEKKALHCARAAIDRKAERTTVLNLSEISSFTDYFVICNGSSDRQVQAIADSIKKTLTDLGYELLSLEGYSEGRWVLMDFGDVVVHIFLDALRDYYDLDALWKDAERLKIPPGFYSPGLSRFN